MAPPEARNRLPPTAQYKVTIPLSKDGHPPPPMTEQPAHLDVIPQPSYFGPGFVTYRDEKTGKREYGCYICTLGTTNTLTHVQRLDRHMTNEHFGAVKRTWLKTDEALAQWKTLLPRYECPKEGCTHVCYRGNRELAIHYRGQHWTDDDAATVEFPRRMDKLTLQCAELIPGRDNAPSSDSDGDDEDDLTYVPPVQNRVDRSIDEDYDGDSASGSELDELSSDTDDPDLHRMEEDSVANSPPPSASAVDDTTMTTHDVNMDAEDDRDDAMSITCTEDGADVNMPAERARTSENVPPVAVAPPKRVRAPRRTAKKAAAPKAAAPKARASAANPRQAFPDGTSAAHTATPHATDASSRGRSGARNTQHTSKPRAATTTPPPKLKRTHSVVESPGKAPSTEAPRAKRVVYERYIERVVVYDAPGAESAPPHIQHFRVYPVDEYEAAQPPPLPPMGHPQGRYPATARSQSTADTPRSPVPQGSFASDVPMEYTPTQSQFYGTQALPMARSRSDTGTTRTPPFAGNIPAGHAPAQSWSNAAPQAVPASATAAPRRPTAGLRPNASDLRRHVVKLANEMSDEQLMLQFQQVNNLGSPRLPQDR